MTDATPRLSRQQALRLLEGAYLVAATGLIWLALYYLPVCGALFRLALPLPLILLQLRRGNRSGAEGRSGVGLTTVGLVSDPGTGAAGCAGLSSGTAKERSNCSATGVPAQA